MIPGELTRPGSFVRNGLTTGVVLMGTSVMWMTASNRGWGAGQLTLSDRLTAGLNVQHGVVNLGQIGAQVDVPGDVNCFRAQTDQALTLRASGYNAAFLDGDSPAANLLFNTLRLPTAEVPQAAVDAYRVQILRLLDHGFNVFAIERRIGASDSGTIPFGTLLREPEHAMYASLKPQLQVVDIYDILGSSDSATAIVPGTTYTLSQMFIDTPSDWDHYSSLGASLVASAFLRAFHQHATEIGP